MTEPTVLLAVRELLQREVDVDVLLHHIVDLIAEAIGADRGTLFLVDRERSELYSKAAHLPELDEIRLVVGQGIAGHVAATGEVVSSFDARADRRFLSDVDAATGYETQSVLAVPVYRHEDDRRRVVAVLEVLNKRGSDRFDDDDRALMERLAEQVAEFLAVTHLDEGKPLRFNKIVGRSEPMQRVYDVVASAAATDATVLITGESGTGKERIARAIHVNGDRAGGPFVKVDCTAIPEGLIEAELFGHEKGAFTGAERMVVGKCELASGGTLFLDEIGEMPLPLQAKLLRFVQERELERVGGRDVIKADVRVVAATNRDLEAAVKRGAFRQDLFYRIKVVELRMPPLRDRGPGDIRLLANHFLSFYARKHGRPARALAPAAMALLEKYPWPGNIRELEHCIESAVVFCPGTEVGPAQLSLPHEMSEIAEWDDARAQESVPSGLTLADVEKRYIMRTLAECNGNRTRCAEILGIGRNTLARKLKRYDLG